MTPASPAGGVAPGATAVLPPGPAAAPLGQVLRWLRRPLEFLDDCGRRYGDVFTIRLAAMPPHVLLAHPDAVREVLTGDGEAFRAGEANRATVPVLGQRSLLALDGAPHGRARRLMLPAFHADRVQTYEAMMRTLADRAIDAWPTGAPFSLHAALQEITLDVILATLFGADPSPALPRLRALVLALLADVSRPFVRGHGGGAVPGAGGSWGRVARLRLDLDHLLDDECRRRRTRPAASDVLGLLLAARDEEGVGLDPADLRDELTTLLVAGHETTATALAWMFQLVLAAPAVREALEAEVAAAGVELPYLDATLKETLRLAPVFAVIGRRLQVPARIGGHELPAGVIAAPCIYLVHRHPAVWSEPERFLPERFLGARPTPYEYLPFGGGPRRCLGMAFALVEMRVVAARVLARTVLTPAATGGGQTLRRSLLMAPAGGVPVVLQARR